MTLTVDLNTEQADMIRRLMILYGDAVALQQGAVRIKVRMGYRENDVVNSILTALARAERQDYANSPSE